jgi:thiol-disulfide isomerase/thioredoxin
MNSSPFTKSSWFRRVALAGALAVVALVAALLPAGPAPTQDPLPGGDANSSIASALGLVPSKTNLLAHTLSATNADDAWDELKQSAQRPPVPDSWQVQEPSPAEMGKYFLPYTLALADKSKDYYTRFAGGTNALDAREMEMKALSLSIEFGATNQQARFDAVEKDVLANTNLTEGDRFDIRRHDVEKAEQDKGKDSDDEVALFAEFERGTRALQKEFPNQPEVLDRLMTVAELSDAEKSRGILKEITSNTSTPDEIRDSATNLLAKLDRVGKPIALQFNAIDGRPVDLAKMQGKVVLLDFWATWCQPCMEEFPSILKTYDQYHAKGFEIVGISFDDDKQSLTNFVVAQKVEWPQYCDGVAMESNKYATEFGVKAIPALWLVDKKGVLRYVNGRFDLTNKIERLIAE